ncbi:MAG: MotA/TolQ/ExbB proton channel family protein [Betaproteobacteria bacterium]|nr:MotA/TolQ/ExbB proton channel family protein [Betaproteobacteria bacterium]
MNDSALGLSHFLAQTDTVARFILVLMLIASLLTWGIITDRLIVHWQLKRRSKAFMARFQRINSFAELIKNAEQDEPYSRLTRSAIDATRHYAAYDASHLNAAGGLSEFLIRSLRQCIEEEAERLERGLTMLASIGSTAPFVGLFGTVWGIYHALIAIGLSGQGTLDKIAGPVGEALIMTAIGLVVAIPAVLGYNALVRRNRVVLSRLDAFGHDLLILAVTGAPLERHAHTQIRAVRVAGGA